jgi:N6-L-threonylcarbamoyladenine synthase
MLLAIETSCDETAVALFSTQNAISGNFPSRGDLIADVLYSQIDVHKAYGGVVPEIAAREHVHRLPILVDEIMSKAGITSRDISAVAVTVGPGLKGCLLVGLCWAKGFALARNIPLLAINHIEGHVLCAEFSLGREYQYPSMALVVSGGHSELVLINGFRNYQIVARTSDDAAGEAFDKTATLLGLGYPGGPALSKKATQGDPNKFQFAVGAKSDPSIFSFSGLKTAAARTIAKEQTGENKDLDEETLCDLAASIEHGIIENLLDKTIKACQTYKPKELVITGGVAANQNLRKSMTEQLAAIGVEVHAPPMSLCTDNAVMIGHVALRIIAHNTHEYRDWQSNSLPQQLGPGVEYQIGASPRFPIEEISAK